MEATNGIPNPLCQLRILQQRVGPRCIKWAHAHIHTSEGKDPPEPVCPEILTCAAVDTLERMKLLQVHQEAGSHHAEQRIKVLLQHMDYRLLIMPMCLLQEREITLKTIFPLEALYFRLHGCEIGGKGESSVVVEVYLVVGITFDQFDAFSFHGGVKVLESLVEELREEQKARPLIETLHYSVPCLVDIVASYCTHVAMPMYQRAPPASEVVLLNDRDL
jgi:hypothetical protein